MNFAGERERELFEVSKEVRERRLVKREREPESRLLLRLEVGRDVSSKVVAGDD